MNPIYKLSNEVVLELYEIQLEGNEGYLRFHGSKNFTSNIVFQQREYLFIPAEFLGNEKNIDGRQSRPSIKIANVNNFISKILTDRNNLIGKKFIRKKVLARDLDISNFQNGINPFGTSEYNTYIIKDEFLVHIKKSDTKEFIELELSSKIDLENVSVPFRKVTNDSCIWKYRCFGCNYGNTPDYAGQTINFSSGPVQGTASSSYFFTRPEWQGSSGSPDLGIPVADENNIVFLSGYASDLSKKSYNLPYLQYLGAWSPTTNYTKGQFVYIDNNLNYDASDENSFVQTDVASKKFFVCIVDNVLNKYPEKNTDVWKEDKCSKNLIGCLLRFRDFTTQDTRGGIKGALPFGAFPGTFNYQNDNRSS